MISSRVGFTQGRLVNMIDGKIQAFPKNDWENEFKLAKSISISLMEWTLDYEDLYENPMMTILGRKKILELSSRFSLSIPSVVGDCFMQQPFWRTTKSMKLEKDFLDVVHAASKVGARFIVVPLVDNGSLTSKNEEDKLIFFMLENYLLFKEINIKIIFEIDFDPEKLKHFIDLLPEDVFGINYDIGNSAALGFDPLEEFKSYGDRILNVHVKDRKLGSTTVPLGQGNANFNLIFAELNSAGYTGNFILQTARDQNNQHLEVIEKYAKMVTQWVMK